MPKIENNAAAAMNIAGEVGLPVSFECATDVATISARDMKGSRIGAARVPRIGTCDTIEISAMKKKNSETKASG